MRERKVGIWICAAAFYLASAVACGPAPADMTANDVVPSLRQIEYQRMELIGFIHFGINTFTDMEWGYGDESPALFDPTDFDADQWARAAAAAGMKELILTAKHHDGFCLWPSRRTEHSVKNSPWRGGGGDVVREFADACRRHGLKVGLYLSPWDRNRADYGTAGYLEYYRAQLTELLTGYGEVTEVWFDGANGGTGYYGGANEERRIDRRTYYDWPGTWAQAKRLQPDILIFSDAGPDIRWTGNEQARAGLTNWSTIDSGGVVVGEADTDYLNTGDPLGGDWVVPLCDASIRPGWFYHAAEDGRVKTPAELVELYYRSVGRNAVLLLNLPPDKRGRLHEHDVASLLEFRRILDETFAVDLAAGRPARADSVYSDRAEFAAANAVDGDPDTYWAAAGSARAASLEIDLGEPALLDRVLIQEPIRFGQRIAEFEISGRVGGEWRVLATGTTIGCKRVLRIEPVKADGIRLSILKAGSAPAISNLGLFASSKKEPMGLE